MDEKRFVELIARLFSVVRELEEMFPGRHFTPDGHLVGSLGECIAAYRYGLELTAASSKGCDATKGDRRVEIKATFGEGIVLRSCPEHLLVLKLDCDGSAEEVYNGPGNRVWDLVKNKSLPPNGQYQIRLAALRGLMIEVQPELRIKLLNKEV